MLRKSLISIIKQLSYYRNQILPIPQKIMIATIRDTHEYHTFIPWCKDSKLLKKVSQMENYTQLTISFNDLKEISYTSHVLIDHTEEGYKITSICKESPLKYLKSVWIIKKQNQSQTNIVYSLDFQFDSVIYQLTSSIFLNVMGKSMMDIFLKRAKQRSLRLKNAVNSSQLESSSKEKFKDIQISAKIMQNEDKIVKYLQSRPKLKQLIENNKQISKEVTKIGARLSKTNNYVEKMNFQIKNMLIHHNISPQSDVFKQII